MRLSRSLLLTLGLQCILALLSLGFGIERSHAQIPDDDPTHPPSYVSVGAIYGFNFASANIEAYEKSTVCGIFRSGSNEGFSYHAQYEIPLSGWMQFAPSLHFRDRSSLFTLTPSDTARGRRPSTGEFVRIERQRNYDARVQEIGIGLSLAANSFKGLKLQAGPYVGYVVHNRFVQTEHIISPTDAIYLNGSFRRGIDSGDIKVNPLQIGFDFSVSYDIRWQGNLRLRPLIRGTLPFTTLTGANESWRTLSIGAGLAISYLLPSPAAEPPLVDSQPANAERKPEPVIVAATDEPPAKPHTLEVAVRAIGIGEHGEEIPEPELSVERLKVIELFPMLNYLFFEDGSSEIPLRYRQSANGSDQRSFSESSLAKSTALEIHHRVLDVIGSRLRDNAKATVTIVGSRSAGSAADSSDAELGLRRAESVAEYLRQSWAIDPGRLKVMPRSLPEVPSDDRNPSGQAENRRVEIVPSDASITAPVRTEKNEHVATPPSISFEPTIVSSEGLESLIITVRQGDRVLQTFDALSAGAAGEHLWTLGEESMPIGADSLVYTVIARDSSGVTRSASGSIRLRSRIRNREQYAVDSAADRLLRRYSLILFDYSSSGFGRRQADGIINEAARTLDRASLVTMTGHTDRTGDPDFNDRLSKERVDRAEELLRARLRQIKRSPPQIHTEAHGARDILFDNDLPEGRFLSRTVRVTVENPKE